MGPADGEWAAIFTKSKVWSAVRGGIQDVLALPEVLWSAMGKPELPAKMDHYSPANIVAKLSAEAHAAGFKWDQGKSPPSPPADRPILQRNKKRQRSRKNGQKVVGRQAIEFAAANSSKKKRVDPSMYPGAVGVPIRPRVAGGAGASAGADRVAEFQGEGEVEGEVEGEGEGEGEFGGEEDRALVREGIGEAGSVDDLEPDLELEGEGVDGDGVEAHQLAAAEVQPEALLKSLGKKRRATNGNGWMAYYHCMKRLCGVLKSGAGSYLPRASTVFPSLSRLPRSDDETTNNVLESYHNWLKRVYFS
jgi:hypothetical protein